MRKAFPEPKNGIISKTVGTSRKYSESRQLVYLKINAQVPRVSNEHEFTKKKFESQIQTLRK